MWPPHQTMEEAQALLEMPPKAEVRGRNCPVPSFSHLLNSLPPPTGQTKTGDNGQESLGNRVFREGQRIHFRATGNWLVHAFELTTGIPSPYNTMANSLISLGLYSNVPRKKPSGHSIQKSKTSTHGRLLAGHQNLSSLLPEPPDRLCPQPALQCPSYSQFPLCSVPVNWPDSLISVISLAPVSI